MKVNQEMKPSPKHSPTHIAGVNGKGDLPDFSSVQEQQADAVVQADTGLGTTYERWALNRLLLRLQREFGFESVLEGPGDGMTGISGINSLVLGLRGLPVAILLPHFGKISFAKKVWDYHAPDAAVKFLDYYDGSKLPFPNRAYNLVWNFNLMAHEEKPWSFWRK
jgi:hypothetical protein